MKLRSHSRRARSVLGGAVVAAGLLFSVVASAQEAPAAEVTQSPGTTMGAFYDALSPYGDWVNVSRFGRVWRPHAWVVGEGFQPYSSAGHWVSTDYGWSFESDYDWGWAPFHYGRWFVDADYGWVWAADTTWGPAWVDWREGGGYVGWAPLPPSGAVVIVDRYRPYWCFVPTGHLIDSNLHAWAVGSPRIHEVYGLTVANHTQSSFRGARWYQGPTAAHIQAASGRQVYTHSVTPPPAGRVQPIRAVPPPGMHGGYPAARSGTYEGGPYPSTSRPGAYYGGGSYGTYGTSRGYAAPMPGRGYPAPAPAVRGYAAPPPGGGHAAPPPGSSSRTH